MEQRADRHEASLIYIIGRVNHGIRREMRSRLAQWGLSVQEYTTLSVLSARPGLSNAQLSRRALVTPQSMNEIMSKLERRGLVKRAPDPSHGLILRTELTAEGRGLLAEADPAVLAIQEEMMRSIAPRDRQAAERSMLAAMDHLSRDSERRSRGD
jgi:DNA-binding MarR family transcriptional regulator